jgi:glycosyltransferase involved in cell wall biosynthesis
MAKKIDTLKVTIITVSYNSELFIKSAIESVLNQGYENIEYLIIDGNSKDRTKKIVKEFKNDFGEKMKYISEPDNGIYDAMNKGIEMSSGEIIGFLNSDDYYIDNCVLSEIIGIFEKTNAECVFANINYVSSNDPHRIVRRWRSGPFKKNSFQKGWHPAHPAFFVKKEIYKKYGNFNLNYQLAADFENMMRFLEKFNVSNIYYEKPIINMRLGGATSRSIKNILKQNMECYKALKQNNISVSPFYFFYRVLPKIKQFFKWGETHL